MRLPLSTIVLALVAAGASFLAWREYREIAEFRAQRLTAEDRAQLQRSAWEAQREIKRLQTQLSAARALHSAQEDAKPGAEGGNRLALGQFAADYLERLDDPEIRRLMDLQRLAGINRQYGKYFRDAKLTPQQIDQFRQLMLERQRAETDVIAAAAQQGINPMSDPQEFRHMVQSAQADIDRQMQGALGDGGWTQLQDYQHAQAQRNVAGQVQADLSYTDTPLTDAQRDQLQQAIAQTNRPDGSGINDKTIGLAQGFLAAPQLEALSNLQKLQQANSQLGQLMNNRH